MEDGKTEMNFRDFNKTRLIVFDFDGTLANVPNKPNDWDKKTKGDWWRHPESLSPPHYNNEINNEVLRAFLKEKNNPESRVILLTGRSGDVSHAVRNVLRTHKLYGERIIPKSNEHAIKKHKNNLKNGLDKDTLGHEEYYSGDHKSEYDYPKTEKGKPDETTLAHKFYIINKLMSPQIKVLEFWEDRLDHIPHFVELGKKLKQSYGVGRGGALEKVVLHKVSPPDDIKGQANIQHVEII